MQRLPTQLRWWIGAQGWASVVALSVALLGCSDSNATDDGPGAGALSIPNSSGGSDGFDANANASDAGPSSQKDGSVGAGDASTTIRSSCKRGLAYGHDSVADLGALSKGLGWWYNWSSQPESANVAAAYAGLGLEFTPMVWGGTFDVGTVESQIPNDAKYLLAFNEPNFGAQANLTPAQAAALWPNIEAIAKAKNLKIVSPALNYCGGSCNVTDPFAWLDQFFAACPSCQVDYVAAHWYACSGDALTWYLGQFAKYGKPIWLTEFSCNDASDVSLPVQKAYMKDALQILENDPNVFRYAWFIGRSTDRPAVSILGADGQLTELGQQYVSAPGSCAH